MWGGLLALVLLGSHRVPIPDSVDYAFLAAILGVILFFTTRIRIWWNHE
jgi:hypothetical protein